MWDFPREITFFQKVSKHSLGRRDDGVAFVGPLFCCKFGPCFGHVWGHFLDHFLITFWITFGEGPAAGADPPEPQEPEEPEELHQSA